jgi:hypothetical protein
MINKNKNEEIAGAQKNCKIKNNPIKIINHAINNQ